MDNRNGYKATVIKSSNVKKGSDIFELCLGFHFPAPAEIGSGQFFSFRSLSGAPWPRPFSVAWVDDNGIITFFIKAVGENTKIYSQLNPLALIKISGPFGKKFELLPGVEKYVFVGGGTGFAGLFLAVKEVLDNGKKAELIFGAKSENDVFGREIFERLGALPKIVVEKSSKFFDQGQATDLLEVALKKKEPNTAVIACGPRGMLKKAFDLCQEYQVPCLVSVEELTACDVGSCGGCAIAMTDGTFKKVCKDGPIFNASEIKWESFLPRPVVQIKSSGGYAQNPLKTVVNKKDKRKLVLDYPWGIAPGCVSLDEAKKLSASGLKVGFWRPKGVTLNPRAGNPSPRICEAGPRSMLNSIGMANIGVDRFIEEEFFEWQRLGKPVIVQIAGETPEEYVLVAEKLRDIPVAAIDIDISCPNLKRGGMSFGTDAEAVFWIVSVVHDILPYAYLSVKLTPNVTDIVSIGKPAVKGGADCLTGINTLRGMRIDIKTRRPRLGNNYGGLSGAALLPVGIAMVSQLFQAKLGADIVGVGGISSGEDALEYLLAGANRVEVGTAWFGNRNIFSEIEETFLGYLQENGNAYNQDLVGAVELFK